MTLCIDCVNKDGANDGACECTHPLCDCNTARIARLHSAHPPSKPGDESYPNTVWVETFDKHIAAQQQQIADLLNQNTEPMTFEEEFRFRFPSVYERNLNAEVAWYRNHNTASPETLRAIQECDDEHAHTIGECTLDRAIVKAQLAVLKIAFRDFVTEALQRPQIIANPGLTVFLTKMRDDPILIQHVEFIEKRLGL